MKEDYHSKKVNNITEELKILKKNGQKKLKDYKKLDKKSYSNQLNNIKIDINKLENNFKPNKIFQQNKCKVK